MKKFKLKLHFFLFPMSVFLCSYLGGKFTNAGMDWYKTINTPSWTPPGSIIGIVWTIIFILLIASMLIAWEKFKNNKLFNILGILFIANILLNAFWSYLFFYSQNIFAALIEMVFLEISIIAMIFVMWKISKRASILLFPYAGWVAFATFLTYMVYSLN